MNVQPALVPPHSTIVTSEEIFDDPTSVAAIIDHTLLKPDASRAAILELCAEATDARFASVCVNPFWVAAARDALAGSTVRVCTVIGFPLGVNGLRAKLREAELALDEGAGELDMVQNLGALKSGDFGIVRGEIGAIAELAHSRGALVKVILETSLLSQEEITLSCRLAAEAHADFVKTSTGFSSAGATADNVRLMRSVVGPSIGVKASGGIRSLADLRTMIEAGANRIGTSSGMKILRELSTAVRANESRQEHMNGY